MEYPHLDSKEKAKMTLENFPTVQEPWFAAEVAAARFREDNIIHVLDIGCGWARNTSYFAKQGFKAIGMDISTQYRALAEELFSRNGYDGNPPILMIGDMRRIPLPCESIDGIFGDGAYAHLGSEEERIVTSEEMYRVLRPGGLLFQACISVTDLPNACGKEIGPNTYKADRGLPLHYFTKDEMLRLHSQFSIETIEEVTAKIGFFPVRDRTHWYLVGRKE